MCPSSRVRCALDRPLFACACAHDAATTVKKQVTITGSALEAAKSAEAVVIATEWKEFKEIDWDAVYAGMNKPAFVFDGRLIVDVEKLRKIGFKVRFVGLLWGVEFLMCGIGHRYWTR